MGDISKKKKKDLTIVFFGNTFPHNFTDFVSLFSNLMSVAVDSLDINLTRLPLYMSGFFFIGAQFF